MADYDDRPGVTPTERATAYDNRSAAATRHVEVRPAHKNVLDWLAILLLIAGGLNWGLMGLLDVDLISALFGPGSMATRAIEIAIGVAGLWGFALMRLAPAHRYA